MEIRDESRTDFHVYLEGPEVRGWTKNEPRKAAVHGGSVVQIDVSHPSGFQPQTLVFDDTDEARFFADLIREAADTVDNNKKVKY